MGWLKPAEGLLEPKGIWDAHRDAPPDGPVPEPADGVKALGQVVKAVRVGGGANSRVAEPGLDIEGRLRADLQEVEVELDHAFDFVPVALLLGIPLMFKRLHADLSERGEELLYETKMYAYNLMTTPGLGLPITWNQCSVGGAVTPLPPLLAARSDGLPFTSQDWMCLCEFHEYLHETQVEPEQLWYKNRAEFTKWVKLWVNGQCLKSKEARPCAFADIAPCLDSRFPLGIRLRAANLGSKPELNGKVGTVVKYDETKGRVGVEFPSPFGVLSLAPEKLEHTDEGQSRAKILMNLHEKKTQPGREKGKAQSKATSW